MQMVNLTASQSRGLATGEMFNRKGEVRILLTPHLSRHTKRRVEEAS